MRVNFGELRKIIRDTKTKTKLAKDSNVCLSEFLAVINNFIEHNHSLMQDELANIVLSMQNWILRRKFVSSKNPVKVGDIFYADLGFNYKPEYSYHHPVIILEEIGNMVMVVPVSTSPDNIKQAYHPVDNPNGTKYLRKVYGLDAGTKNDGFEKTGAVLLADIKTISQGRLIEKKGSLSNISSKNSLFYDIKTRTFALAFPKKNIELYNANKKLALAEKELDDLKKEHKNILDAYNALKDEVQSTK